MSCCSSNRLDFTAGLDRSQRLFSEWFGPDRFLLRALSSLKTARSYREIICEVRLLGQAVESSKLVFLERFFPLSANGGFLTQSIDFHIHPEAKIFPPFHHPPQCSLILILPFPPPLHNHLSSSISPRLSHIIYTMSTPDPVPGELRGGLSRHSQFTVGDYHTVYLDVSAFYPSSIR